MIKCWNCGNEIPKGEETFDYNGEMICGSCREDEFYSCDHCGELTHSDDMTYTQNERSVCPDCLDARYTQCQDCGEYISNRDIIEDGDIHLCHNCYMSDYGTCERCDHIHRTDDLHYSESNDASYCDSCYPNDDDDDDEDGRCPNNHKHDLIHEAKWKPSDDGEKFFFYREPSNEYTNLYFGVELEITDGDVHKYDFDLSHDLGFYECYDGSIDCGHEVISHPMSYNYIMKHKPYDELCGMITRCGYRIPKRTNTWSNTTDCGLHISMSRDAFDERYSKNVLYAYIYLFEKFWREVVTFSRRPHQFDRQSNPIDSWAKRRMGFDKDPNSYKFSDKYSEKYTPFYEVVNRVLKETKSYHERYHAVNIQNSERVETRIFLASLDPEEIYASIQLTKIFFEFAHFEIPYLERLTWFELREMTKESYPEFDALCDRRKI